MIRVEVARLLAGATAVCVSSWLILAVVAGSVGLQRSIARGAATLFEQPVLIVFVAAVAFAVAYASARGLRLRPGALLVGVLVGDAIAGLFLAPLAIGELEPIHAPLVFAAVSLLGVQPAAALAGAWTASLISRSDLPPAGR